MRKANTIVSLFFLLTYLSSTAVASTDLSEPDHVQVSSSLNTSEPRVGVIGNKKFGIGLNFVDMWMQPAISAKYWFTNNLSLDLGFCIPSNFIYCGSMDVVWNFRPSVQSPSNVEFIPYVGIGAEMLNASTSISDEDAFTYITPRPIDLGLKIPGGLEFVMRRINLSIFAELSPYLLFSDPIRFLGVSSKAGIRYYF